MQVRTAYHTPGAGNHSQAITMLSTATLKAGGGSRQQPSIAPACPPAPRSYTLSPRLPCRQCRCWWLHNPFTHHNALALALAASALAKRTSGAHLLSAWQLGSHSRVALVM